MRVMLNAEFELTVAFYMFVYVFDYGLCVCVVHPFLICNRTVLLMCDFDLVKPLINESIVFNGLHIC